MADPQAKPSESACAGGIGLSETVEYIGQKFSADARSGVAYDDFNVRVGAFQSDLNPPFASRKLDCV